MRGKFTGLMIIIGVLVLCIFIDVAIFSVFSRREKSNSYYLKVDDKMDAQIEAMEINDDRLKIMASDKAREYCVKSTKSTPDFKALCWKKFENQKAIISIYHYKKYYIWIKDSYGNVSSPMSINTSNN